MEREDRAKASKLWSRAHDRTAGTKCALRHIRAVQRLERWSAEWTAQGNSWDNIRIYLIRDPREEEENRWTWHYSLVPANDIGEMSDRSI